MPEKTLLVVDDELSNLELILMVIEFALGPQLNGFLEETAVRWLRKPIPMEQLHDVLQGAGAE